MAVDSQSEDGWWNGSRMVSVCERAIIAWFTLLPMPLFTFEPCTTSCRQTGCTIITLWTNRLMSVEELPEGVADYLSLDLQ